MSCYEFEKGTLKFSTIEYRRVKKGLIEAYNKAMESDFLALTALYEALCAAGKGKRNFNWSEALAKLKSEQVLSPQRGLTGYYYERRVPKYAFSDVRYFDTKDALLLREEKDEAGKVLSSAYGTPLKPKKKDFPQMATSAKNPQFSAQDGTLYLNDAKRTMTWSVSENNHAIEHSRESTMGQAFFKLLDTVKWTRGTGGHFVTNNEYNQENTDVGGAANLLGDTFGPLGEAEKDMRNRILFAGLDAARGRTRKPRVSKPAKTTATLRPR